MTAKTESRGQLKLDDLMSVRTPCALHRITLSPDGRYLACSLRLEVNAASSPGFQIHPKVWAAGSELWVFDLTGNESWKVLDAGGRTWAPSWSPDGSTLAFYADHTGTVNLWLWDNESRKSHMASDLAIFSYVLDIDKPRWSPDSSHIFVPLWPEGSANSNPAHSENKGMNGQTSLEATVDVLTSDDIVEGPVMGALMQSSPEYFRDIGVVDLAKEQTGRLLTGFPILGIYPSPDGQWLALVSVLRQEGAKVADFESDVYLMRSSGGTPQLVGEGLKAGGYIHSHEPAWSPDSTELAFVQQNAIFVVELATQKSRKLKLDLSVDPLMLLWHPHSGSLLTWAHASNPVSGVAATSGLWLIPTGSARQGKPFLLAQEVLETRPAILKRAGTSWFLSTVGTDCIGLIHDARTHRSEFWQIPLDGGSARMLRQEESKITASESLPMASVWGDASIDGKVIIYAAENGNRPPDFWITDPSFEKTAQVTRLNPHMDEIEMGTTRLVSWRTYAGREIQGTILLPPHYESNRRIPVITMIYPGSFLSRLVYSWDLDLGILHAQLLASRGYGVFLPDLPSSNAGTTPRGQGLAGAILAGINEIVDLGIADGDRLGLMGQSAGGHAVNRLITETGRFKAAVSVAGIANMTSYFGQLRLMPDGSPFMSGSHNAESAGDGLPWSTPLRYLEESPVFHLDAVQTPLLLIHGTEDDAVGIEQSGEMFVGLRRLGKTTTFLRFHGEGHSPSRFSEANRRRVAEQIIAWFDEHLQDPQLRELA